MQQPPTPLKARHHNSYWCCSYVEQLELKLQALQQQLQQQQQQVPQILDQRLQPPTPQTDISNAPSSIHDPSASSDGGERTSLSVPDINSPVAHLTLAAMAEERQVQHANTFALPAAVSAVSGFNGSMLTSDADTAESFAGVFAHFMTMDLLQILEGIRRDQADRLIQAYLRASTRYSPGQICPPSSKCTPTSCPRRTAGRISGWKSSSSP